MLANINRLRKDWEIKKVFKDGKKTLSDNFTLCYLPNRFGYNRFAIVVGTKVSKLSTRRNALKRRMREIVRQSVQTMPQGFDIALLAHKLPNWPLKLDNIKPELSELFKKIK